MNDTLEIRTMRHEELNTALDWAAKEGWNVGLRDSECFYAADPEGFVIALENGEPAGCISAVNYGPAFGFLGLFIVRPELRGKGYGKRLWNEATHRLKDRVAGLDAVTAREDMYTAMGFQSSHVSTCFVAKASHSQPVSTEIKHLSHIPFDKVCDSDRRHFPAERRSFLDTLVRTPATHSFACVVDGELRGWGAIRQCRTGWKIGPFYAETESVAEDLFNAMQHSVPEGEDVFVATPLCNDHAKALAKRHAMSDVFDTVRMYRGPEPQIDKAGIYSLASFELG